MEFTDEEKQLLQDQTVEQFQALVQSPAYLDQLRNQFASAALAGLIASGGRYTAEDRAEAAFILADAMLKARKEK